MMCPHLETLLQNHASRWFWSPSSRCRSHHRVNSSHPDIQHMDKYFTSVLMSISTAAHSWKPCHGQELSRVRIKDAVIQNPKASHHLRRTLSQRRTDGRLSKSLPQRDITLQPTFICLGSSLLDEVYSNIPGYSSQRKRQTWMAKVGDHDGLGETQDIVKNTDKRIGSG